MDKNINRSFISVTAASVVLFYMATVFIRYASWAVRISDLILDEGLGSLELPDGYYEIAMALGQGSAIVLVTIFRILFVIHLIAAITTFFIGFCARKFAAEKKILFRFLICFSCISPLSFFIGYLIVILMTGLYITGIIVDILLLASMVCAIVFAFRGTATPKPEKQSLPPDEMPIYM